MRLLFSRKFVWFFLLAIVVIGAALYAGRTFIRSTESVTNITETMSRGEVSVTVTVSGKIEASNMVKLGFPTMGTVQNVYRREGDKVTTGEVLASLTQDSMVADYDAAVENLRYLESEKEELLRGRIESERLVSETQVQIAKENVARVEAEQARIVQNTLETLRSSALEAIPTRNTNTDIPPTITGSYLCDRDGTYTLSLYPSHSPTNYSYILSGLEEGTFTAFTDVPNPLGTCGLYIQFDREERYHASDWTISIPNTRSAAYLPNYNAHRLALQQQANAVATAGQALELARRTETSLNADPSKEALKKVDAAIAEARALLTKRDAQIADYTIRAPFNGIITENNIKIGETVTGDRLITLLEEGLYEFKARIPEVDIANIHSGNQVQISFDAKPEEEITGTIQYISPNSIDVDGVAYYEATLMLQNTPDWIRVGLNADVRVIMNQKKGVLVLPERFLISDGVSTSVLIKDGTGVTRTPVDVGLIGNNGYVEILNLSEGVTVILP